MRESITSSEDELIIVNPQSSEKPVNGSDLFGCAF